MHAQIRTEEYFVVQSMYINREQYIDLYAFIVNATFLFGEKLDLTRNQQTVSYTHHIAHETPEPLKIRKKL